MLTCRRGSEAPNGLKRARVLRHLVPMMSGLIHRLNADTGVSSETMVGDQSCGASDEGG